MRWSRRLSRAQDELRCILKKDHLSNTVSIEGYLSENGVVAKIRSRMVSAVDRLLGSLIDIPTAKLEKRAAQIRRADPSIVPAEETAIDQYRSEQVARQVANKRHVVEVAIENLKDAPGNGSDDGEGRLNDDWLNYFEEYAEKASTENMRGLWGSVLAGEIRKPRSFSLTTLRFMSELDQTIAAKFEAAVRDRITGGFILKPEPSEMSGPKLLDLMFLEEIGLLQGIDSKLTRELPPNDRGEVYWWEGDYILTAKPISDVRFTMIKISRIGCEVAEILKPPDPVEVLQRIGEKIYPQVSAMRISVKLSEDSGDIVLQEVKILKSPENITN